MATKTCFKVYSAKLITQHRFICYVIQIHFISTGLHPIDSLYTVESVKDTVPVIEHIFGAKNAR